MNTFLFVAKPKFRPERVAAGENLLWSCSSETRAGDRAYVYVTGKGIHYEWRALSDAQRVEGKPWPFECMVQYVAEFIPLITLQELRKAIPQKAWNAPHVNMKVRACRIPAEVVDKICALRAPSINCTAEDTSKNYWITTHWPQRVGDETAEIDAGIYLPEGRQQAANDMKAGDMVAVYETKNGRTLIRQHRDGSATEIACKLGREGMICYGVIEDSISADSESDTNKYTDGTEIWWHWHAPVSVRSRSGFVERPKVLQTLGYSTTWNLRGFGDYHSGLKKITRDEFNSLVQQFHASRPIQLPEKDARVWSGGHGGGEGEIHRNLKNYVADNPAVALSELGLSTLAIEYEFPTNDRADIVLVDRFNRIVGVEIEPAIDDVNRVGLLQAIKYQHMLECAADRERGDSRGILIAHRIGQKIKALCAHYGIEHHEIPREAVAEWMQIKSS